MNATEMNKEAFKEFSKIVLFCCNYCKRKVYIRHLKIMLGYYLTKNDDAKLLEFSIGSEGVEIKFFEEYLKIMQKIDFVEFDKNLYGTIVIAKKKLEMKVYSEYQLQILQETIVKSLDDLQDYLNINIPYSQDNETGDLV